MPKDFDAILDDADFAYRDVPICLKRSARARWDDANARLLDLVALIEAADGEVTRARQEERDRLEAEVAALEQQIVDNTVTFHVVGIPFSEYNALILDHPPREGNLTDRMVGYNTATFHPAVIRRCTTSPDLTDDARWARLVGLLTDGEFDGLATAANEVNRRLDDGRVPFSRAASPVTPGSDGTSSSPDSSG